MLTMLLLQSCQGTGSTKDNIDLGTIESTSLQEDQVSTSCVVGPESVRYQLQKIEINDTQLAKVFHKAFSSTIFKECRNDYYWIITHGFDDSSELNYCYVISGYCYGGEKYVDSTLTMYMQIGDETCLFESLPPGFSTTDSVAQLVFRYDDYFWCLGGDYACAIQATEDGDYQIIVNKCFE